MPRMQCDRKPDACANCEKAGYRCPGYRNQIDLMFCDETKYVIEKSRSSTAAAENPKASTRDSTRSLQHLSSESRQLQLRPRESLNRANTVSLSIHDRALAFFFAHHLLDNDLLALSTEGRYLSPSPEDAPGKALLSSSIAMGIAELSASGHSDGATEVARRQYLQAIRQINAALTNPAYAKEDSLLLAVLILTTFEAVTCEPPRSLDAWSSHVYGATALLELRGPDQFRTPDGLRMFVQVVVSVMTNCTRLGIAIPDKITALTAEASRSADEEDVVWRLFRAKLLHTDFLADVTQKRITDLNEIFNKALELDKTFLSIASNGSHCTSQKTPKVDGRHTYQEA